MPMDYDTIKIDLKDDATVGTLKRLFAGLDVDDCTPCIRQGSELIPIRRIEIEGPRVIFEIY